MLIFSFNPEYALRGFFMKEKHASPTNIPLAAKPYKYKVKNEVFFLSCCFSFLLFFFLVILFCVNKTCLKWKKKKKKKNLTKSHSFKHRYCQIFIKAGLKILNQIKYFFLKKRKGFTRNYNINRVSGPLLGESFFTGIIPVKKTFTRQTRISITRIYSCLLYTSDAADE